MDAVCQDCGHQFFLPGELQPMVAGGGCENCGSPNVYRNQPTPLHSEMSERNMPLDGKHPDTGGNPLQEGILADDGWEPYNKRDESFASVRTGADSDLVFDFGLGLGAPISHTVIATRDGRIHSLPGEVRHEHVADQYNLHRQDFPTGMSLGYVKGDGTTSWFQHDSGHTPESLANALQSHMASNYGVHVPVTVDPALKPTTNEERWSPTQPVGPQRELDVMNTPARPRRNYIPNRDEKEWAVRGGSVTDTLNTEPYDSFLHQADAPDAGFNAPNPDAGGMHSIEVQPGERGLHAGPIHWLKLFDASVNGQRTRDYGDDLAKRYGRSISPEFGAPVTVSVHHPDHLPAVQSIVQEAISAPTDATRQTIARMQNGEIPWPPGIGGNNLRGGSVTKTAFLPFLVGMGARMVGGALLGGAIKGIGHAIGIGGGDDKGGGGGGGAPQQPYQAPPMSVAVPEPPITSATHEADIPGKIDTPGSTPRMPVETDPERIDPHELNDGEQNKNPYGGDMEAGGSQAPHPPFDDDDIQQIGSLGEKLLEYYNSPNSALEDPDIRALHERLETKHPGYLDMVSDDHHAELQRHLKANPLGVTAAMPGAPMGAPQPSFQVQPSTGAPVQAPPMPGAPMGPGAPGAPGAQGRCQYCGGTTTADGSCPQCGASVNPMGGQLPGQPGQAQPGISTPPVAVASVHEADGSLHPGPVTPEQQAAVAELLVAEGRADEIPTMETQPHLYSRELARIKNDPNQPPPPVDPSQEEIPPAPAQEVAPPGATMPVPDPSQQIAAAVAKFAADSFAPRCPDCGSATTGFQNASGDAYCHSCTKSWKPTELVERKIGAPIVNDPGDAANAPDVPAADQEAPRDVEQEQDTSLTWADTGGQPLQTGQEYYIHTPRFQIPDLAQIVSVKPDSITVKKIGEVVNPLEENSDTMGYSYEISKEEAEMDQLTFEPAGDDESATTDFSDARNNVQDVTGPNTEPQAPRTQMSSLNTASEDTRPVCPNCGEGRRISSSMSSPTTIEHDCYRCAHIWETQEELEEHTAGVDLSWINEDSTPWDEGFVSPRMAMGAASRSLSDIADKDDFYQQRKAVLEHNKQEREQRLAGAKFTPREKRDFIDEEGVARNSDRLDLDGTHYEATYRTRDDAYGRGDLVPDDHMLGMF